MIVLYPQVFILFFALFYLIAQIKKKPVRSSGVLCHSVHTKKTHYLLLWALGLMILALSRPVLPSGRQTQKSVGSEAVIALDLSYSMHAKDLKPSRYLASVDMIKTLLKKDLHDRFALYGFTTKPLILSPATTDHRLIASALDAIEIDDILTHGTSIKNLLLHLSKQRYPVKNLILITDGGEEKADAKLNKIVKNSGIRIIAVGMASKEGTLLEDAYGKKLKDEKGNLVISTLNPLLKSLASQTHGSYIRYTDASQSAQDIIDALHDEISSGRFTLKEKSYTQLYYIPLFFALLLIVIAFLRLPKKLILLFPFLFSDANAGVLDWFYINHAKHAYEKRHYKEGAIYLQKLSHTTMQSRFDEAMMLYKVGKFHKVITLLKPLKSKEVHMKKQILFLMGNTYSKIKKYDEARKVYKRALLLEDDPDIVYNLALIKGKHTHAQPKPPGYKKKEQKSKTVAQKEKKHAKKDEKSGKKTDQKKKLSRPLGYKAYELINKGYINEKNPW